MTVQESGKLLTLICDLWPNFRLSETSAESWAVAFSDATFDELVAVVRMTARSRKPGYLPDVTDFSEQLVKLRHPMLALEFHEGRTKNSKLYQRAKELVMGPPKPWTPYASPDAMPLEKDRKWDDKAIEKAYYELRESQIRKRAERATGVSPALTQADSTKLLEQVQHVGGNNALRG